MLYVLTKDQNDVRKRLPLQKYNEFFRFHSFGSAEEMSAKKYLLNGLARDRLLKDREKKVHTRLMGVTSFQISTVPLKFTKDDAFRI